MCPGSLGGVAVFGVDDFRTGVGGALLFGDALAGEVGPPLLGAIGVGGGGVGRPGPDMLAGGLNQGAVAVRRDVTRLPREWCVVGQQGFL